VKSVRTECDHSLMFEAHLRRAISGYAAYFNYWRPHRSPSQRAPVDRSLRAVGGVHAPLSEWGLRRTRSASPRPHPLAAHQKSKITGPSRPVGVVARRLGPRLVNTKAPCSCSLFSPHSGIGKRKSHCTTCSPMASPSQPLGELHCGHNKRENHARQARSTDRTVEEKLDQTQLKHQRMRSKALKAK
jgi:hypothetical protein